MVKYHSGCIIIWYKMSLIECVYWKNMLVILNQEIDQHLFLIGNTYLSE